MGKISRSELEQAMPLLSTLFGEEVVLCEASWQKIDEDGNHCVNLSEFACWAGPRLGLPLGVGHLFDESATDEAHGCAIIGCPCEGYRAKEETKAKLFRKHTELTNFVDRMEGNTRPLARAGSNDLMPENGEEPIELCKCGHKFSAHRALEGFGEVPCPMYWDRRDTSAGDFIDLVPLEDEHTLELFQDLMDLTYRPIFTRDRKKHNPDNPAVPRSFDVVRVFRSENSKIWREYGVKRAQLLAAENPVHQYEDIVSSVAWMSHGGVLADRLR